MEMRGLQNFIAEIRGCKSKEQEQERIEVELAKIRKNFKNSNKLSSYDRRKYVTKLLYMYMLGYEVDFGHMEAITLLASTKYVEKHVGYLACSLLLDEAHELLTLLTNQVAKDLALAHNEDVQCLALMAVANVGGKEFSEALFPAVLNILTARETRPLLRKKSALTALRLFRKYPELLPPDEAWREKVLRLMSNYTDLGQMLCVSSFVLGYASKHPESFEDAVSHAIRCLHQIVIDKRFMPEYVYFQICCPWLQVKLLRLLQYYPPPEDATLLVQINQVLERIMSTTEWNQKHVNRNNASHSVLFEVINVVVHYDHDDVLMEQAASIIGTFIGRELNLKYLGLDAMAKVALKGSRSGREALLSHKRVVVGALNDSDISIRRRGLDVLYYMCDEESVDSIVQELLEYLKASDFAIREELVLKIAILAERFATDFTWYVDVVLKLISYAGDYVSDDIWFRVIQIVTNSDNALKRYAASTVLEALESPAAHENAVKIGGYIVGEFGYLIDDESNPEKQFDVLHAKFATVSNTTRAILLNAFAKIVKRDLSNRRLTQQVFKAFDTLADSMDTELQQRACELKALVQAGSAVLNFTLGTLPDFERQSSLLKLIEERQRATEDRNIWVAAEAQFGDQGLEDIVAPPIPSKGTSKPAGGSAGGAGDLFGGDDMFGSSKPAAAAAPAASSKPGDLFDIFGDSGSSSKAASGGGSSSGGGKSNDFMDMFDMGGSSGGASSGGGAVNFSPSAANLQAYHDIVRDGEGVVMEDANISVTYRGKFKDGRLAQLGFYLYNKTSSQVSDISGEMDDIHGLRFKENKNPYALDGGAQGLLLYLCECYAAFGDSPILKLSYSVNGRQFGAGIKVPITLAAFIQPRDISADQFRQVFADPSYSDKKAVFEAGPGVDTAYISNFCQHTLHLTVLSGVDNNPVNLALGGFVSPGAQETVFHIRFQFNAAKNLYRLVVRTQNIAAIDPVIALVTTYLAKNGEWEPA